MTRFIHYEYGGGAVEYRRTSWLRWAVVCLVLFGISLSSPRLMQQFGILFKVPTEQVNHAPTPTASVPLQAPAADEESEEETTAVVDAKLQKQIEQWAKRDVSKEWGVVVERIDGAEITTAQYQPDKRFQPANLYKLLITHTLSEKISSDQWAKRNVYDYRGAHTYTECVDLMLRLSDNGCGDAVGNALGWKLVDGRLTALGLKNTKLNAQSDRFTSAADMAKFMRLIHEENILSNGAKQQVFDSLKVQKFREGIPAGVPGCQVYNKVGDLNGYKHDVAFVECGELEYSLAILSKDGSYTQIAELTKLINQHFTK